MSFFVRLVLGLGGLILTAWSVCYPVPFPIRLLGFFSGLFLLSLAYIAKNRR